MRLGRTLLRLWLVGTSLWIIGCSVVIYNAYRGPYDLWLFLDPADAQYRPCWPKTAGPEPAGAAPPARRDVELNPDQLWYEAPWQHTARIRRVATCYRALNRIHQTTTRLDVLKQGVVTIVAVPALVLAAGALLLTSYPRRSNEQ